MELPKYWLFYHHCLIHHLVTKSAGCMITLTFIFRPCAASEHNAKDASKHVYTYTYACAMKNPPPMMGLLSNVVGKQPRWILRAWFFGWNYKHMSYTAYRSSLWSEKLFLNTMAPKGVCFVVCNLNPERRWKQLLLTMIMLKEFLSTSNAPLIR